MMRDSKQIFSEFDSVALIILHVQLHLKTKISVVFTSCTDLNLPVLFRVCCKFVLSFELVWWIDVAQGLYNF